MSNMSYCRFENTSRDFSDCLEAVRTMVDCQGMEDLDFEEGDSREVYSDLSDYEKRGLKSLLEECEEFKELAEELLEQNTEEK